MSRFLFLMTAAALAGRADSLDQILGRMDSSAKKFQSMSAKLKQIEYTDVLKDTSESTGEIRLKRSGNNLVAVARFNAPDEKTLHFAGKKAQIYYPKNNTVEIYDVGKYQGAMNRWLALGFGTSGAELRKEYDIKLIGPEKVGADSTTRIELTPRSEEMRRLAASIDLWIPDGASYPIQEKVIEPSKNTLTFVYSDVKINPPLSDADVKLKLPAGVREVYPGK